MMLYAWLTAILVAEGAGILGLAFALKKKTREAEELGSLAEFYFGEADVFLRLTVAARDSDPDLASRLNAMEPKIRAEVASDHASFTASQNRNGGWAPGGGTKH